jgi:hypothetical protein
VKTVPIDMPPTRTRPIEFLAAAPAPVTSVSGKCPATVATLVIRIGRSRVRAASWTASSFDLPASWSLFANSTIRMPFFAISPTSVTRPTCE